MQYSLFVTLALAIAASARPFNRRASFDLANGQAAIALNDKFKTLTADSPCSAGDQACVNGGFAQCVGGKFSVQPCSAGTTCAALPLVNSAGTSITCDTQADITARLAATGATAAAPPAASSAAAAAAPPAAAPPAASAAANTASTATADNKDIQNSLTLSQSVIATGFTNNGQAVAEPGQVASLTSNNNFINFCATVPQLPITNGKQITTGSCNPAPMGAIPSVNNMPSAKFVFPPNQGTVKANTPFNISMAVSGLETGNFVNAQQNYFAAPQQLNAQGQIIGHSHVVIEAINGFAQTTPLDPTKFAFFKGLNNAAVGGLLTALVPTGLPAGTYRMASINTAANHQPALVPVAQHGSLDDAVYFTVN